jgi:hypothetical protein
MSEQQQQQKKSKRAREKHNQIVERILSRISAPQTHTHPCMHEHSTERSIVHYSNLLAFHFTNILTDEKFQRAIQCALCVHIGGTTTAAAEGARKIRQQNGNKIERKNINN